MTARRILFAAIGAALAAAGVAGCHVAGHVPPGQIKNVVAPPPGHGGIPPGQMKKN